MRATFIGFVFFASGCAFIDPFWEFTTSPPTDGGARDAGPQVDAGPRDAGPPVDGSDDAGPVGPEVCRACTVGTDVGCPTGYGCYVRDIALPTECTVCVERTGDAALGDACTRGPDCAQGFDCIHERCRTFCDGPTDCGGEDTCYTFSDSFLTGWCLSAECDPLLTGECPTGEGCLLMTSLSGLEFRLASSCGPAGTVAPGQPCDGETQLCQPGAMCFGADPRCSFVCRSDTDCVAPQNRCIPFGTLAGTDTGLCLQGCVDDTECTLGGLCNTTEGVCI